MLTQSEAIKRVARGAAVLDAKVPGWASRIDVGKLDIASGTTCIVCQVWDLFHLYPFPNREWIQYGALLQENAGGLPCKEFRAGYALLQDAWISAIADRVVPKLEVSAPISDRERVGVLTVGAQER